MITASMTGLAATLLRIDRLKPVARRGVQKRLEKQAAKMVADMREAVPVDSGALRDSIRSEPPKDDGPGVRVMAGGTPATMKPAGNGGYIFDEALGVEYGTTKRGAEPFFFPVVEQYRRNSGDDILRGVQDDLDREGDL